MFIRSLGECGGRRRPCDSMDVCNSNGLGFSFSNALLSGHPAIALRRICNVEPIGGTFVFIARQRTFVIRRVALAITADQ